jgi:hypothetical protein
MKMGSNLRYEKIEKARNISQKLPTNPIGRFSKIIQRR